MKTEGDGPLFGGLPTFQRLSHSMNRKKTYSNNIIQDVTLREGTEVHTYEDGVEGKVEDTHDPFGDSKEKLKMQE